MTQILIIGGMVYLSIVDNFYFGQLPYGYNFLFRDVLANIVYILFYYISLLYINKKTYKDSKLTFHNFRIKEPIIQLFLFMLIFANAFSLFDYAYYYGKIYYPTILLLAIIITLVSLFSVIFLYKIIFKKYLGYTVLDNGLTQKYSSYSKKFGKNIDIYKSIDDDNINKLRYTPAFSFMLGNKYNIIISSEFLKSIDNEEKNALILHEIGHLAQYKNESLIRFIISFLLILVLSSLGVIGIIFKSDLFLFSIIALLSFVILIFMILIKPDIFNYLSKYEKLADNFALKESNNKKALISLLLAALSYDLFEVYYNEINVEQTKILIDERLEKLDYLNAFNNDNDYYENRGFK